MGSKLTRQSSLDSQTFFRRRRQHHDAEKMGRRGEMLFSSLMVRSDKLPGMLRKSSPSPYVRRVAWVREIQTLLKEHKVEQALDVLKLLRKVQKHHLLSICMCLCFLGTGCKCGVFLKSPVLNCAFEKNKDVT